ncbi:SRPBCC domain-containing protein [Myceligenerans crystallogenes]|uniref:SRPBCC domain-containing protein n=1 Tax=Myceligenerans crystallogenes TaxID=316335 RepID=A0ABN2N7S7_9MICO
MEYGSIERELFVNASPEVVFDVVSNPEHVKEWWSDDAEFGPGPGSPGWLTFGDPAAGGDRVRFQVADAVPHTRFAFRWTHADPDAAPGNSNLVVFELTPADGGTMLRFSETGFRERGWAEAKVKEVHDDHTSGWDHFLPQLVTHAERIGADA